MFNSAEFEIFLYWIQARERVRRQKEFRQPKPWTDDPLLRDYRWCNVRRLNDAVSRSLFAYWYSPPGLTSLKTQLTAAAFGRLINWPPSLMAISGGGYFCSQHLTRASEALHKRAAERHKVFTGAYVIPGVPGESKIDSICGLVEAVSTLEIEDTMRTMWLSLTRWDGLGSFLAGQIVADMAHLQAGRSWPDRDTWAPLGPGSARGINRLLGRPKDKAVTQGEFETLLPKLIAVTRPEIDVLWTNQQLQAMDIQNCLCEYDKYRRLTLGEGKVRARYDGRAPAEQGSLI